MNLSNGNLHFAFGSTSCVTCGGGSTQAYPSPMASQLTGPVLIFNSLGTPETDLGPHWMLPYMASATTDSEGNVTILDYDGTVKVFTLSGGDVPAYASDKESDVLTADTNDYILTRCNGDRWKFPKPPPPADGDEISFCYAATSRPGQDWEVTRDGNGHITKHFGNTAAITGVEAFTYDFEGHMTLRELSSSEATDTHEYDGNGRRMRSKLNSATNWTNFIHDELTENLICEYTLISGTFTIKALNTYGLGLISTNREGTIRYFHFDGLGSTAHLTDTSQNITDTYTYDAFGNPLSTSGSSVNPYRYVGQWGYYNDGAMGSSSGMLLLGVRYYWPKYGRFATWDPDPGLNLYDYANASPTMAIDPNGLRSFCDDIGCGGSKEDKPENRANYATRSCCCEKSGRSYCCTKLYVCGNERTRAARRFSDAADALEAGTAISLIPLSWVVSKTGLFGKLLAGVGLFYCARSIADMVGTWRDAADYLDGRCKKKNGCACIVVCKSQSGLSTNSDVYCCQGWGR